MFLFVFPSLIYASTKFEYIADFQSKQKLNNIFKEYEIKINFSKDSICSKQVIEQKKEYTEFKDALNSINPERKLNSLFSNRLKI